MEKLKSDRLREMSAEELSRQMRDVEEELFNLQVRRSLQPPDDPLQIRYLRRQIARIKTVLREAELGIVPRSGRKAAL